MDRVFRCRDISSGVQILVKVSRCLDFGQDDQLVVQVSRNRSR